MFCKTTDFWWWFLFCVAAFVLAVFLFCACKSAQADILIEHKAEPSWSWPASVDGAECLPKGVRNWEEEYKAPDNFRSSETYREKMIREIEAIWVMFFADDRIKAEDKRRLRFHEFASYLTDAITLYQDQETDKGGRLPKHFSTHRLLASMVTLESAVRPRVQGALGEVGLIQVFGRALGGFSESKVRRTPYLGLLLGTRWLAVAVGSCYPDGINDAEWTTDNWLGPLSVYAAGAKRGKHKNGTCKKIAAAHARVGLTRMYGDRL